MRIIIDLPNEAFAKLQKQDNFAWLSNVQNGTVITVPKSVYMQVARERDIAIEQLNELGYEFGEKIELCKEL